MYVTSTDPMHMLEYMRRVNDVKMNAGTIEVDRDGEDSEGEDNGMRWTQRAQLRTDWGSAELRNEVAPVTHDKWQIEVDLGQLKVMEGVGHVKALVGTLRDEGIVREMAGRLFERVTAVFWSGESFKAKQTGEKYAKYRAEGTGLALEVEQDGHLPECGKVVSGRGGEMETVIAMSYAVMRAHETQKTMCVNCHVTQRTKDGNDHECGNFRECSSRVWEAMQRTKRAPEAARPPQQLQRFRDGRSANRRDKAKGPGGPQRNPRMVSGGPGMVVAYGSYERNTWEEKRVVFILDIARGQEAKGEQWETGRRVMRQIVVANREWADEYHLVARAVARHATKLYENIGFKRDVLGGTGREYQPRPEWLEEYWTVKATVLETELQGEMMEGGRWPRTYALEGGLEKGSKEWKGVQKIYERTHKSDRGGDGTLWGKHEKEKPHVVVWKETGSMMEREEAQGVDDPAFHKEEEDDPEEGGTAGEHAD